MPSAKDKKTAKNNRLLSIGQAASFLGISIDTLRNWEELGKVSSLRAPGGIRRYSLTQLKKLQKKDPKLAKKITPDSSKPAPEVTNTQPEIITLTAIQTTHTIPQYIKRVGFFAGVVAVLVLVLTSVVVAGYIFKPEQTKQALSKGTVDRVQVTAEEQILGVSFSPLQPTTYNLEAITSTLLSPFNSLAQATIQFFAPQKATELGFESQDKKIAEMEKKSAAISEQLSQTQTELNNLAGIPRYAPTNLISTTTVNLLRNSSFENNPLGQPNSWFYTNNSTDKNTFVNNASVRSGYHALRIQPEAGKNSFGLYQPYFTTLYKRSYALSLYLNNQSTDTFTLKLGFWDKNNNKRITSKEFTVASPSEAWEADDSFGISGSKWKRYSFTLDPPNQDLTGLDFYPMIEILGLSQGNVFIDDIQLEEGTSTSTFAQENMMLGDGSVFVDAKGNIFPTTIRTGSLGTNDFRFNALYLTKGSIDSDGNTNIGGNLTVDGDGTLQGDLAVNGGDITSSNTDFNLLNSNVLTLNIGGAATSIGIGSSGGTTTINNNLAITGTTTFTGAVTSTGGVLLPDGSASSPALRFTNDTDSGLYRLAADVISLVTGGTAGNGITINSSGNLGIGTTTPQVALEVKADSGLYLGAGNDLQITLSSDDIYFKQATQDKNVYFQVNDGGTNTNLMFFNGSESRVGINTTGPSGALDVRGASSNSTGTPRMLRIQSSGGDDTNSSIALFNPGGLGFFGLAFGGNTATGTRLGVDIAKAAMIYTGGSGDNYASLLAIGTSADIPLIFSTNETERVRLTGAGNLGIGTTSPLALTHIYQTGAADALRVDDAAADTSYFVVDQYGNVGIGVTAPTAKLEVNGNIKATTFNGNTITEGTGTLTLGASKTLTLNDSTTFDTNAITFGGTESLTLAATKNVTFADEFITSGAYSLTLTTTGATNVTLPTTGTLATLAGTETLSGKTFSGDTIFPGPGIWSTSGNVGIGTTTPGANTRLSVMGGNVGIGTTSPLALTHIYQTAAADAFLVYDEAGDTSPFVIDATGQVGIGFTSPAYKLDVNGTARFGATQFTGAITASTGSLDIGSTGTRFGTVYADTVNATSLVGTVIGGNTEAADWTINYGQTSEDTEPMTVTFERGNPTPNAILGWDIGKQFTLNSGLAITAGIGSGNVGIGTTAPFYSFEIRDVTNTPTFGMSDDDVAHSFTDLVNADTFAHLTSLSTTSGGALLQAFSDGDASGFNLKVGIGTTNPTDSTPAIKLIGGKLSGTTLGDLAATETVFQVANNDDTAALSVMGSGNIGIGTTTSTLSRLTIAGGSTTTGLAFLVQDSAYANRFAIQGDGNVGIGTTAPGAKLHIATAGDTDEMWIGDQLYTRGGTTNILGIGNSTGNVEIGFGQSNDNYAQLGWTYNATAANAYVKFFAAGGNNPIVLQENGGNVGIGTTAPGQLLDIAKSTDGAIYGRIQNNNSGTSALAGFTAFNGTSSIAMSQFGQSYSPTVVWDRAAAGILRSTGVGGLSLVTDNAAGYITFHTGGNTERMRVDAAGNVGIGTTSPGTLLETAGTAWLRGGTTTTGLFVNSNGNIGIGTTSSTISRMTVAGGSATTGLAFLVQDSAYANRFAIQGDGNVGIGTTAPGAGLNVTNGTVLIGDTTLRSSTGQLVEVNTTANNGGILLNTWNAGNAGPILDFRLSASNTIGASALTGAGDALGYIRFMGNGGPGNGFYTAAGITAYQDAVGGAGDMPGRLVFTTTADGASSVSERLRIDSSGYISLAGDTDTYWSHPTDDTLAWTTAGTERVRISSDGNVGIGTTAPFYSFEMRDVTNTPTFGMSDDDVAHSFTDLVNADTFAHLTSLSTTSGGALLQAFSDGDASGFNLKVGIGTTNPTDSTPAIKLIGGKLSGTTLGDLAATETVFQVANNDDAPAISILGNGNVGIGTTAPGWKFEVANSASGFNRIANFYNSTAKTWSAGTTADAIGLRSVYTGQTTVTDVANINWGFTNTYQNSGATLAFDLIDSGGNWLTAMTVKGSGNVGIGTTAPSAFLNINGTTSASGTELLKVVDAGATNSYISFKDGTNVANQFNPIIEARSVGTAQDARTALLIRAKLSEDETNDWGMRFQVMTDADEALANAPTFTWSNNATEQMRIAADGNVGIGTTSPGVLLQLRGTTSPILDIVNTSITAWMRLDSTGGAGGRQYRIGSTTDANGVVGGGKFAFYDETGDAYRFVVDAGGNVGLGGSITNGTFAGASMAIRGGNVGIGTTAPLSLLQLRTVTGSDPSFSLADADVAHSFTDLVQADMFYHLSPLSSTSGGALLQAFSDGDASGFNLKVGIGTTNPTDSTPAIKLIGGKLSGTTLGDLAATETVFQVANNDDAPAISILGNGNVGIGTTAPSYTLDINGPSMRLYQAGGNPSAYITADADKQATVYLGSTATALYRPSSTTNLTVWAGSADVATFTSTAVQALKTIEAGSNIKMTNGTSNTIFFGTTGAAAPGDASAGEKIQLYGTSGTISSTDYALGVESNNVWFNSASGYKWYVNSAVKNAMDSSGNLGIGTTAPFYSFEMRDVTNTPTFGMSDDDVAHSFTDLVNADTFAHLTSLSTTSGGALLQAFSDGDASGFNLKVGIGTTNPTDSTPAIKLIGGKLSGTTLGDLAATETVFQVANNDDTAALSVMGSGNIGIGTTTSTLSRLTIAGGSTTTGLAFLVQDSAYANRFAIQGDGNVGIGTTGPSQKLEVSGSVLATNFKAGSATFGPANTLIDHSGFPVLTYVGTTGAVGLLAGGTNQNVTITPSGTGYTILNGNVGIGTTSPLSLLQLRTAASSDPSFSLADADVAHGVTTIAPTDDFLRITPISSTVGGAYINGLADATGVALQLRGIQSSDPTDSTPAIFLVGAKASGTGVQDLGATETVFQVANNDDAPALSVMGSGNIGIGTTTSTLSRLTIAGGSATTGLAFLVQDSAYANRFAIQGDGNVGIGTTAPGMLLTLTGGRALLRFNGGSTSYANTQLLLSNKNAAVEDRVLTALEFEGTSGFTPIGYGGISTSAGGGGSRKADFVVYVADDDNFDVAADERLRITSTGNVGIGGDTSPDYLLELYDGTNTPTFGMSDDDVAHGVTTVANTDTFFHLSSISTTDGGAYLQGIADNVVGATAFQIRGIQASDPTDSVPAIKLIGAKASGTGVVDLGATETIFAIANNDDAPALVIQGNGEVGIGNTNPISLLDVSKADAGNNLTFRVSNTDNTNAASHTRIGAIAGGDSAGDPYFYLAISGGTEWSMGVDNSQSDSLKISSGGAPGSTDRLTILTDGNVGIGTTAPGAKLTVVGDEIRLVKSDGIYSTYLTDGSARMGYLQIHSGGINLDSEVEGGDTVFRTTPTGGSATRRVTIDSNGNVGIGNDTTPDYLLELYDPTNTPVFALSDDDVAHSFTDLVNADTFAHLTSLSTTAGGAQLQAFSDGDASGFNLKVGIGTTNPTDSTPAIKLIGGKLSGTTLGDLAATETVFQVANNDDAPAISILGNGNVGIGTTSPLAALEVKSDTGLYLGAGNDLQITLSNDDIYFKQATQDKDVYFQVNDGGTNTNLMFFDGSESRVGIGTTNPQYALDVSGSYFHLTGGAIIDGSYGIVLGHTNSRILLSDEINIDANSNNATYFNAGNVGIGTTSPLSMLQLRTATGSDPSFSLADADVAHSFTSLAEADMFYHLSPLSSTSGGGLLQAFSDGDASGFNLKVGIGTTNPTDSTPAIKLIGGKLSGTTLGDLAATETVFQVANNDDAPALSVMGSGNIGIGTTTSTLSRLTIAGGSATTGLAFLVQDSAYANRFAIQGDGNVGIGTTAPGEMLDISGSGNGSPTNIKLNLLSFLGNTYSANSTVLGNNARADTVNTVAGQMLYSYTWSGGASAINMINRAGTSNDIEFHTTSGSVTAGNVFSSPRMIILGNGNVGIGTTSPLSLLQLRTATGSDPSFSLADADVAHSFTSLAEADMFYHLSPLSSTSGGGLLQAFSDGDASGFNLKVGIGTTNPTDSTPAIKLIGGKLSGTTLGDLAATETVFQVANNDDAPALSVMGSGNIGIGTTTSTLSRLTIAGGSATTGLAFLVQDSAYANRFAIQGDGNVGIGTTSPSYPFVVGKDGTQVGSTNFYNIGQIKNADATKGINLGYDNSEAISILASHAADSGLAFWTRVGDTYSEKVRITSAGNVGIGTTAPGVKLEVVNSATTNSHVVQILKQLNTAYNNDLELWDESASRWIISARTGSGQENDNSLIFYDNALNTVLDLEQGGNVGIATAAPLSKLGVLGNAAIGGAYGAFSAPANGLIVEGNVGIGTTTPQQIVEISKSVDGGGPTLLLNNTYYAEGSTDEYARILAYAGGATLNRDAGEIRFGKELDFSTNGNRSSYMAFYTNNANSDNQERMRISATGNVGIGGDTTPDYLLELYDVTNTPTFGMSDDDVAHSFTDLVNADTFAHLTSLSTTAGGAQLQAFSDGDASGFNLKVGIGTTNPTDSTPAIKLIGGKLSGTTLGDLAATETVFQVANNDDAPALTILGNGNVGIGTTRPAAQLQINSSSTTDWVPMLTVLNPSMANGNHAGRIAFGTAEADGKTGSISFVPNATANLGYISLSTYSYEDLMVIRGDGNVGIGTTAPLSKLHLYGSGLQDLRVASTDNQAGITLANASNSTVIYKPSGVSDLRFWDSNNGDLVTIASNGNVGIGTTAPNGILHIQKDQNADTSIQILNATSGTAAREYVALGSALSGGTYTSWEHLNASYTTDGLRVATRTILGGYDTEGLLLEADGTTGMIFATGGSATTNERMRITSGGNVGIGTTSPGQKLQVVGNIDVNGAGNSFKGSSWISNTVSTGLSLFGTTDGGFYTKTGGVLQFVNPVSGAAADTVTFNAGNVGIGTTSPNDKLEVSGGPLRIQNATNSDVALRFVENTTTQSDIYFDASEDFLNIRSGSNNGLRFLVNNASDTAPTMQISSSGNVGIGTTSPIGKLDIVAGAARTGTHATAPSVYITGSLDSGQTGTATGNIEFRHDNGTQGLGFGYNTIYAAGSDAHGLNLLSKDSNPITLNAYAYSTGNVGVGTTNPTTFFQVSKNQNSLTQADVVNANSGSAAVAVYKLTGDTYSSTFQQYSSGYTSTGINQANTALLYSNTPGGINLDADHATGIIGFYTGGNAASNERMRITSNGNVGIGTTAPTAQLELSTGVAIKSSGTAWDNPSDIRLKNIQRDYGYGLSEIMQINPVVFTFKEDNALGINDPGEHIGIVAQEVQGVIPEAVTTGAGGYLKFNIDPILWALVNAVKEENNQLSVLSGQFSDLSQSVFGQPVNGQLVNLLPITENGKPITVSEAILELNAQIAAMQDSFQVDSEGYLVTSGIKADKIVLGPELGNVGIALDEDGNINLAATLENQELRIKSQESSVLGLEEKVATQSAQLASTQSQLEVLAAQIASMSSQLSGLSSQSSESSQSGVSQPVASSSTTEQQTTDQLSSDNGQQKTDNSLNLTDPSVLIATQSAQLGLENPTPTFSEATISGQLTAYSASISETFKSLGETFLGNTIVAGNFSVDGTLSISQNSINAIGTGVLPYAPTDGILYLQNSPLASGVDFFNGLVTIDKTGNLTAQTITAQKIITDELVIGSETLGTAIIPAGQLEIPVFTNKVKAESKIFLTATSPTGGQSLIVGAIEEEAGFVVSLDHAYSQDIKFNWWIVDAR